MELVPDMCPEKQRSIYDGFNVADALAFANLEMYSKVWQANVQMKRDVYGARMVTLKDVVTKMQAQPPTRMRCNQCLVTSCPRSSTSKSSALTMWLVFWTWHLEGGNWHKLA